MVSTLEKEPLNFGEKNKRKKSGLYQFLFATD